MEIDSAESTYVNYDLEGIMVPLESCCYVGLGAVDLESVGQLIDNRFDHAPVISDGRALGIIATKDLKVKAELSLPLDRGAREIVHSFVRVRGRLSRLFEVLRDGRAAIVYKGDMDLGMVTISDLNKHLFRAHLYPLVARLEASLAKVVDQAYADPWEWIAALGQGQVQVVGHWQVLKRSGLDVSATAGATLSQLLKVASHLTKTKDVFGSKAKFDRFASRAARYRNAIMHPARPLISQQNEIESLRKFLVDTETFLSIVGDSLDPGADNSVASGDE